MTRIYISERGSDRNDGLTRETAIHSWKKARQLANAYMEISVDGSATRKRLIHEMLGRRGKRLRSA